MTGEYGFLLAGDDTFGSGANCGIDGFAVIRRALGEPGHSGGGGRGADSTDRRFSGSRIGEKTSGTWTAHVSQSYL